MDESKKKIDAIYALREAAERKAHAERTVDEKPSAENKDKLLDKQIELEEKTLAAIEVCHDCGHEHSPEADHIWDGGN